MPKHRCATITQCGLLDETAAANCNVPRCPRGGLDSDPALRETDVTSAIRERPEVTGHAEADQPRGARPSPEAERRLAR
jgi:hypothetical protein